MIYRFMAMLAMLCCASVVTADSQSYIGGSLSSVDYDERGIPDLEMTALSVRLGKQVNENFAVEGRLGFGVGDDSVRVEAFGMPSKLSMEIDNYIGVYGRFIVPLGENISVYGMLGMTRIKATMSLAPSGMGRVSVSDTDTSLSFGVGADLSLTDDVFLSFEYAILNSDDDYDFTALSLGVSRRF